MKGVDKSVRFINFLIDMVMITFIIIFLTLIIGSFGNSERLYVYVSIFGYYFILETFTEQTLGKMVTNTKVVMKDGSKPNVFRIFMRSFLRIIPLDVFTYLFGKHNGLHDILSGTRLVKKESAAL